MQVYYTIKDYWFPHATSGTHDPTQQKLAFLHHFLSYPDRTHLGHFLALSKIKENPPVVAAKVQEILTRYPQLKHLLAAPSLAVASPTNLDELQKQIPPIGGDVLDVKCTLEEMKLIVRLEGKKPGGSTFKGAIFREFDDELAELIAENLPQLESLKLWAVFYVGTGQGLSDKGLESIARLKKLKKLNITSELSPIGGGFEKLLSTQTLQAGLNELTIHHSSVDDKVLGVIARYQALKSLDIRSGYLTTQGLQTLFQSFSLQATLEKMTIEACDWELSKGIFNDAILTALLNYKQLKDISLGSKWEVTPQVLAKFLDAHKNISSLALKGTISALDAEGAKKIGEMKALTSLQISDCSKLSENDFCALLNNKTDLTQLNLGQAQELADRALEKLSQLPQLAVFYLAGSRIRISSQFGGFCNAPEMQKHLKELYLTDMLYLPTKAYAEIGKLAALNVLRFDNCPQFNDDPLRSIFETLNNQLTTLQLKKAAITKESFKYLNDAPSLKKLLIASCFAIDDKGRHQFFDLANLQKNLKVLLLDYFDFDDSELKKLINSFSLELLAVVNNYSLSGSGWEDIWNIHENSGGQAWGIFWLGGANLYDIFDNN